MFVTRRRVARPIVLKTLSRRIFRPSHHGPKIRQDEERVFSRVYPALLNGLPHTRHSGRAPNAVDEAEVRPCRVGNVMVVAWYANKLAPTCFTSPAARCKPKLVGTGERQAMLFEIVHGSFRISRNCL